MTRELDRCYLLHCVRGNGHTDGNRTETIPARQDIQTVSLEIERGADRQKQLDNNEKFKVLRERYEYNQIITKVRNTKQDT